MLFLLEDYNFRLGNLNLGETNIMKAKGQSELISNRRALHQYEVIETFEAGIVLQGTEIKSLRDNGGSLQESYVKVLKNELWLIGCNIAPYRYGNIHNHEEKRERKLLMHKRELELLHEAVQQKGLTLIALSFYFKDGRVKVKVAIAKGKTQGDKRLAVKERDDKRDMQRALKGSD